MYPPQVLKHGEYLDPAPGTVYKVPPVSPRHENHFTQSPPNSHHSSPGKQPSLQN
uniref:Uncharacterized protein n=1 Tax=Arundo donax TaxID=35708 RepID=A0A0A9H5H8_ARUDO